MFLTVFYSCFNAAFIAAIWHRQFLLVTSYSLFIQLVHKTESHQLFSLNNTKDHLAFPSLLSLWLTPNVPLFSQFSFSQSFLMPRHVNKMQRNAQWAFVLQPSFMHDTVASHVANEGLSIKWHYQKRSGSITQNVTNKSNVTRHILNTQIWQLPGSGWVATAGYPNPISGKIPYPSHL